ncbi:MAG TPA: hypothetical protein GXZ35_07415 [Acholeplasmataceae bacterium]|jgi:hypothetical protein|nr:hypothetical protein [Acholeplasmataceae bacterium]
MKKTIDTPNLEGRTSRCIYYGTRNKASKECSNEVKSDSRLPFFKHNPNKDHDEHYCGCWGWD